MNITEEFYKAKKSWWQREKHGSNLPFLENLNHLFEMTWEIHRVMQDSQNLDTLGGGAIEDDVPTFVITIRGADDLITFLPHLWFFSEVGESIFKLL